ncbi:MAG: penicillin-binding protein 1A [Rhodospirillales bacterium]|nr:penicillin-binding protein 1A [Rhodospirillales bacterium]MDH3917294.1 penicillin-binding protein 1A [Rhodospirillales bacterium]MDH3966341.1 penicillin-binding protein 1A [Rhodospirillales bacterium]
MKTMKLLSSLFALLLILAVAGGIGALYLLNAYGSDLPDYQQLASYDPPTVTRVHAGDGRILAEYAIEKRVFVPIEVIPKRVINAFISAEDQDFYDHYGVDFLAIARAAVTNIFNMIQNKRPVGASTITQQVAKNFLLSNELKIERKIREAILAFRIERAFTKDRILELYLNKIYLGFGSYGVAAASLNYFDKSLDELTLAEAAYLAALPKAPNNYHPINRPDAAVARRDWVIGRMLSDGSITAPQAEQAWAEPLVVQEHGETLVAQADYFAEEVRRELVKLYGEDKLYQGGLSVRTTLDPRLQVIADTVLREGLLAYDRRHGWRGPVRRVDLAAGDWHELLAPLEPPAGAGDWKLGVVLEVGESQAQVGLKDGTVGQVPFAELAWARPWKKEQNVGPEPKRPRDVLSAGDVVLVEPVAQNAEGEAYPEATLALRQVPEIEGGLVAMDPHTGRVLAMSGGWSYERSQFNRATQAYRQPGSAFKPIVYLAALDSGLTPSTIVLDAPYVVDQGAGEGKWKPHNYSNKFYGPTLMRVGIEKSRNLMTVRLAEEIGMRPIIDYAGRLGVVDHLRPELAMALGAGETTLLRLTTAYAMLVNGGRRITPTLIDRVQGEDGQTVYRHDQRVCMGCEAESWTGQSVPELPDEREQVADPQHAYQIVSMLEGVVQRGTGWRAKAVGKPIAGKTGTTNESQDTWFIGFTPDLAVGVFVGFDAPRSLGRNETGSSAAAPVFTSFMAQALEEKPAVPFRVPPGIRLVRINMDTGQLAKPGDRNVIREAFKDGTVPDGKSNMIDGGYDPRVNDGSMPGTDGLY